MRNYTVEVEAINLEKKKIPKAWEVIHRSRDRERVVVRSKLSQSIAHVRVPPVLAPLGIKVYPAPPYAVNLIPRMIQITRLLGMVPELDGETSVGYVFVEDELGIINPHDKAILALLIFDRAKRHLYSRYNRSQTPIPWSMLRRMTQLEALSKAGDNEVLMTLVNLNIALPKLKRAESSSLVTMALKRVPITAAQRLLFGLKKGGPRSTRRYMDDET